MSQPIIGQEEIEKYFDIHRQTLFMADLIKADNTPILVINIFDKKLSKHYNSEECEQIILNMNIKVEPFGVNFTGEPFSDFDSIRNSQEYIEEKLVLIDPILDNFVNMVVSTHNIFKTNKYKNHFEFLLKNVSIWDYTI